MNLIKIFAVVLPVIASVVHAQEHLNIQASHNPEKWELVWNDEFNRDGSPDNKNWGYESGFVRNQEAEYYTLNRLKNAHIENGNLVIRSLKEEFPNAAYNPDSANDWRKKDKWAHYTSACLTTQGKKDFLYGRIEIRAKLSSGIGSWPAIWLVGSSNYSWPRKGEIDIMEHLGYDTLDIYGTVHALSLNPNAYRHKVSKGDTAKAGKDIYTNYHIYAIEWYKDKIEFYFDDTNYFTYIFKNYNALQGTFNKPFYLMLNNAVGGGWGGKKGIDDTSFPQQFYIDYVRYFKQKG